MVLNVIVSVVKILKKKIVINVFGDDGIFISVNNVKN